MQLLVDDKLVRSETGADDEKLAFAHQVAFGRPPTGGELSLGREFLRANGGADGWVAWCHLLVQANEFVVIE